MSVKPRAAVSVQLGDETNRVISSFGRSSGRWRGPYARPIEPRTKRRDVAARTAQQRRPSLAPRSGAGRDRGRLPIIGRVFPQPVAAKVPEIIVLFWVIKILTTAGGEATSDYLKTYGNIVGGGTEVGLFVAGLVLQFGTRRYRALAYWFLAFAIAIFGTGVSDFLHLDVKIPYAGTTALWAVILAAIFWIWHRSEGTLSIHSITTQRREAYYWATVFATFALGTALGDFTATALGLGYLASGILFGIVILIPALAWWRFGLNDVVAFWCAYVVTRPLGASFADYISKPHGISGVNFGDGPTAVVFALVVVVLVLYLAVRRPDIQPPLRAFGDHERSAPSTAEIADTRGLAQDGTDRPIHDRRVGGWPNRGEQLLPQPSDLAVSLPTHHESPDYLPSVRIIGPVEGARFDDRRPE
jgi:uncharacterized membrane-anchored protein